MKIGMENKLIEVETNRQRLYESAKDKLLTDPEVIRISNELDRSIYEYYALKR
ncbi:MAG TPA: aspartyl-phosphate phosphatase Spo0E family protein [Desulfosporosinus sp.]